MSVDVKLLKAAVHEAVKLQCHVASSLLPAENKPWGRRAPTEDTFHDLP